MYVQDAVPRMTGNQPKSIFLCNKVIKRFPHLLSYSSLTSYAVPTRVWQVRELIWLNINPEVNIQLSFWLAQIWLYVYPQVGTKEAMDITYWNSPPNHHSFSRFEPQLCSSLQFGGGACAEVLCLINKELSYWKNQPTKESSQNSWSFPAWPQHG